MSSTVLFTIAMLSALGLLAAVILYFVAQKFKVVEDPRIDTVNEALPGANCGGCGYTGCRAFAETLVKSESFEGLNCPVGGADTMARIAVILDRQPVAVEPRVAVVRCNGSPDHATRTSFYDGAVSCRVAHALYGGQTACQYGCLGCGDCVEACKFDAMYMDPVTQLPVIIDDKCVACGACVKACPRNIIELRKRNKKDRKIYVSCVNRDKGGPARKACQVACIGCGKCVKVCPYEAITMENNLAFIDSFKCKLCRKCVTECPTGAILEIGFPVKEAKPAEPADAAVN
ncbi:MAG TPA: Fe-S cluster domain-containing protein [Bacteroidales bacterium]|jgi:Na+-translocating ferredoxin:NAD+ oxidoreductase RNF subunit RnfB|nr:Fe-S cluster domain-containing protein [Bacteroidales bacterium]HOO67596.1 Fe-S cluster domain-containing protein [Bacteroidales bacterium]HPE23549.1 Fe-S cluster domain-containing protein [Bacteroidales bacterium]HPJ05713.1 Fe-S cluster domain-containing protein [Bacteroidales bacterium]HPQ64363.1 Fe-S cluster domain-containing protein [Bacteroidales bacterium]